VLYPNRVEDILAQKDDGHDHDKTKMSGSHRRCDYNLVATASE